ncbi:MAG: hypothetical protein AB7V55_06970, partial [Oscillospiraceae bacterium]
IADSLFIRQRDFAVAFLLCALFCVAGYYIFSRKRLDFIFTGSRFARAIHAITVTCDGYSPLTYMFKVLLKYTIAYMLSQVACTKI